MIVFFPDSSADLIDPSAFVAKSFKSAPIDSTQHQQLSSHRVATRDATPRSHAFSSAP
jgi:hypothetical protein